MRTGACLGWGQATGVFFAGLAVTGEIVSAHREPKAAKKQSCYRKNLAACSLPQKMTQGRDLGVLNRLQSVDIVAKQKTDFRTAFTDGYAVNSPSSPYGSDQLIPNFLHHERLGQRERPLDIANLPLITIPSALITAKAFQHDADLLVGLLRTFRTERSFACLIVAPRPYSTQSTHFVPTSADGEIELVPRALCRREKKQGANLFARLL